MKYLDQHLHAFPLSKCSRLSQTELVAFYLNHPEFVITVADHMSLGWYDKYVGLGKTFSDREVLYNVEVSLADPCGVDLVLSTYDLSAFDGLREILAKGDRFLKDPPLDVLRDERILVTWAHPECSTPSWMKANPDLIDFVEFNATHLAHSFDKFSGMSYIEEVGCKLGDPGYIVGSDSHQGWTLGSTFVIFDEDVFTSRDIWNALKEHKFTNRWAEHTGYGGTHNLWLFSPDNKSPLESYPGFTKLQRTQTLVQRLAEEKLIQNQLDGWPEDEDLIANYREEAGIIKTQANSNGEVIDSWYNDLIKDAAKEEIIRILDEEELTFSEVLDILEEYEEEDARTHAEKEAIEWVEHRNNSKTNLRDAEDTATVAWLDSHAGDDFVDEGVQDFLRQLRGEDKPGNEETNYITVSLSENAAAADNVTALKRGNGRAKTWAA
jgi:hypothetical protein